MIILSLFLCATAIFLILIGIFHRLRSELVEGTIIGYGPPVRGLYGIRSFNYQIKVEYKDKVFYVTAMQSKTKFGNEAPTKNIGKRCLVYFNPKSPKMVSMKGFYGLNIAISVIFILGFLGLITSIIVD